MVRLLIPKTAATLALVLSVVSCVSSGFGSRQDPAAAREIQDRKAASIATWRGRMIGGSEAFTYIHGRMGYLIAGKTKVDMQVKDGEMQLEVRSGSPFDIGSAVAVSADGYYLTAAHCVERGPLKLIGYNDRMLVWGTDARVVWKGEDDAPDLALIHIPADSLAYFPMAETSGARRGVRVLSGGLGGLKQNVSGGEILSVRPRERDGVRWVEIGHTTPLVKGDSGGPIIDEGGRLMGISSTGGAWTLRVFGKPWIDARRATSVWVDPAWLRSLIEEDRRKHGPAPQRSSSGAP